MKSDVSVLPSALPGKLDNPFMRRLKALTKALKERSPLDAAKSPPGYHSQNSCRLFRVRPASHLLPPSAHFRAASGHRFAVRCLNMAYLYCSAGMCSRRCGGHARQQRPPTVPRRRQQPLSRSAARRRHITWAGLAALLRALLTVSWLLEVRLGAVCPCAGQHCCPFEKVLSCCLDCCQYVIRYLLDSARRCWSQPYRCCCWTGCGCSGGRDCRWSCRC